MKAADDLRGAADRAVARARTRGAQEAEAYLWDSRGVSVLDVGRRLLPKSYDEDGVAIRVAVDGRPGFGSVTGTGPTALDRAIGQALESARLRGRDATWRGFADPEPASAPVSHQWHEGLCDRSLEEALREARELGDALRGPPDVSYASVDDQAYAFQFAVANERGVQAYDRGTCHAVRAELRTGRGEAERAIDQTFYGRAPLDLEGAAADLAALARDAVRERHLDAAPRTVVLGAEVSWFLGILLGYALSGDRTLRGVGALRGTPGDRVFSPGLTVMEDNASGFRTTAYDDEGVPSRRKVVVDAGVLRSYLWHTASARTAGVASTGNGLRGLPRYQRSPVVGPMNLRFEGGRGGVDELVASADDGVLVRGSLMGLSQLNLVTGEFSLVAPCAWRIERGGTTARLGRVNLAGNVHDCLANLRGVGADAYASEAFTMPSLAVDGILTGA